MPPHQTHLASLHHTTLRHYPVTSFHGYAVRHDANSFLSLRLFYQQPCDRIEHKGHYLHQHTVSRITYTDPQSAVPGLAERHGEQ